MFMVFCAFSLPSPPTATKAMPPTMELMGEAGDTVGVQGTPTIFLFSFYSTDFDSTPSKTQLLNMSRIQLGPAKTSPHPHSVAPQPFQHVPPPFITLYVRNSRSDGCQETHAGTEMSYISFGTWKLTGQTNGDDVQDVLRGNHYKHHARSQILTHPLERSDVQ